MPQEIREVSMVDIRKPDMPVQVEYNKDRKVLYVHCDGMTILRIQDCTVELAGDLPTLKGVKV